MARDRDLHRKRNTEIYRKFQQHLADGRTLEWTFARLGLEYHLKPRTIEYIIYQLQRQ